MDRQLAVKGHMSYLIAIAAILSPLLPFSLIRGAGFHDNQRILEVFCGALSAIVAIGFLLRHASDVRTSNIRLSCLLASFFCSD
ncbi:hypothetical protein GN109_21135 [Collimonas pratensis]|uniref:hypothetical protein n=1 Tax=Collimonas pratensis TaxID=279113 RepID=UPI00143D835A|nr:hypothetical protein [Collimonas pratensis]NKI71932.1 hypothetical protein [Collimonas pratensis]